ncbi:MAG: hypothetical protein JXB07_09880 [Anaerolineae bacterium]|nr:hypothetical protein [Anaerolineae bacterium]
MLIDQSTGTINFPNGLVVTTELDKRGFENSASFGRATPYDHGTLPFQWFELEGGQVDGQILGVRICFYSDLLVIVNVGTSFYQPNQGKWDNFSFEVESKTKSFHDQLLRNQLGEPHKTISRPVGQNQPALDYCIEYHYGWGTVWSGYDGRAGSSSIVIGYGSRLKDAQDHYRMKKE